uniref:Uncharacterized LOC111193929 n=1 Tax=Astyanax mexicanus TaxID=7994 RepID=A0A3B1ILR1_ASTMX
MFAVVVFTEKNEVEVVPSCWLSVDQKISFWPPFKKQNRVKTAVVNREEPDENWGEYLVKVLKIYDTYEMARKKLVKATKRDTLTTSEEESSGRHRTPSAKIIESMESNWQPEPSYASNKVLVSPPQLVSPPHLVSPPQLLSKPVALSKSAPIFRQAPLSQPARPASVQDRDYMIFRALEEIKAQVRQNTLLLQALSKRQPVENVDGLSMDFRFPLTSPEDIRRVEDLLKDQGQEKALKLYLASFGGSRPTDIIRRVMSHVMTDSFAVTYNWMGRGDKQAFSQLKLTTVIKAAAKTHQITEAESEACIKNWLKYSGDRSGGRKRRAERMQDCPKRSRSTILSSSDSDD